LTSLVVECVESLEEVDNVEGFAEVEADEVGDSGGVDNVRAAKVVEGATKVVEGAAGATSESMSSAMLCYAGRVMSDMAEKKPKIPSWTQKSRRVAKIQQQR